MKKIEAFIQQFRLDDVRDALAQQGVHGMSVSEVHGFGRQKGYAQPLRGGEGTAELVPKVKLEAVVADDEVSGIVETIVRIAKTGQVGDGKIFVFNVERAIRVRTGECDEQAL
jgi:nitrogen regulatory protein P-II 1